jgi:Carboxypeptidase regulatory-like domain
MKTQKRSLVLSLFCLMMSGLIAHGLLVAQTATSGTVVGTALDPSGAAVPNASVQLLNVGTNATLTATSNNAGEFTFGNVPPGNYKVTVTATGFRTTSVANLTVDVNKSVNVPVHMEIGAQSQVVEVTAAAAVQLQTQDAQIGNVMSTENILRLPTLQRNATELMNLQPGVVASGTSGHSVPNSWIFPEENSYLLYIRDSSIRQI